VHPCGGDGRAGAADRSQAGFALIIVLWFLVLIAAIGTFMIVNARSQTALAHNVLAATRAEAVADAAVAQSVFNLMEPDPKKRWRLDDTPYVIAVPGGQATVRLEDEHAKINPNTASDQLLAALFEALGMDNARAGHLGASIADWVGKGDQPRPLGAKLPQYQDAGRKYGPPDAPVDNMDELQLVLGMTPEILAAVRPFMTIYTAEQTPSHLATVSAPVYRALQIVAQQPANTANPPAAGAPNAPPAPSPPAPGAPGSAPQAAGAAAAAGDADAPIVTIEAIGKGLDGGTFVRRAVVKLDFANPKGYVVLDWRRGILAN
jgi:general secretion pathway protein K